MKLTKSRLKKIINEEINSLAEARRKNWTTVEPIQDTGETGPLFNDSEYGEDAISNARGRFEDARDELKDAVHWAEAQGLRPHDIKTFVAEALGES